MYENFVKTLSIHKNISENIEGMYREKYDKIKIHMQ